MQRLSRPLLACRGCRGAWAGGARGHLLESRSLGAKCQPPMVTRSYQQTIAGGSRSPRSSTKAYLAQCGFVTVGISSWANGPFLLLMPSRENVNQGNMGLSWVLIFKPFSLDQPTTHKQDAKKQSNKVKVLQKTFPTTDYDHCIIGDCLSLQFSFFKYGLDRFRGWGGFGGALYLIWDLGCEISIQIPKGQYTDII